MIPWNSTPVPELNTVRLNLRLFDTASQRLVDIPQRSEQSLYVCGITPYDATHLGHASTYVAFDLLNRAWRDSGSVVRFVQNVTDVDDPLLERATAIDVNWRVLADDQITLFRTDMEALNILPPDQYIGTVEAMEWIISMVKDLMDRKLAYMVPGQGDEPDGDIYFSLDAAASYNKDDPARWSLGEVSHLDTSTMLALIAERGGDPQRPHKRNPLDSVIWRAERKGEPAWFGGSLGNGRPGWHVQCAVIAQRYLPASFTVQGGGSDLVFPHHEMTAGHAWAATGAPLARHYVHAGMVKYEGEKMSKSRGNLVLVSELRRAGVDPAAIRLAILAHHYNSDWSWTGTVLEQAVARLAKWREAAGKATDEDAAAIRDLIREHLANNLDAPSAIGAVDARIAEICSDRLMKEYPAGQALADVLDSLLGVKL